MERCGESLLAPVVRVASRRRPRAVHARPGKRLPARTSPRIIAAVSRSRATDGGDALCHRWIARSSMTRPGSRGIAVAWPVRSASMLAEPRPPSPTGLQFRLERAVTPGGRRSASIGSGRPLTVVVEIVEPPEQASPLPAFLKGKEVEPRRTSFPVRAPLLRPRSSSRPISDELVLTARGEAGGQAGRAGPAEVQTPGARGRGDRPARSVVNPVDLGTILVPNGWLLLGPGQAGVLEVAAISPRPRRARVPRSVPGSRPARRRCPLAMPLALKAGRERRRTGSRYPSATGRSRRAARLADRQGPARALAEDDPRDARLATRRAAPLRRHVHEAPLRRADLRPRPEDRERSRRCGTRTAGTRA